MDHKEEHNGVDLEQGALGPHTKWDILENPTTVYPVCHDGVDAERRWDRRALKVLALAGSILGERRYGHIEAGKASEAAENKEGEAEGVGNGAHAEAESHHGRCDTKRDLPSISAFVFHHGRG